MATAVIDKSQVILDLERATSDYLSVSRQRAMFGEADYLRAEEAAWERLMQAKAAADAEAGLQV